MSCCSPKPEAGQMHVAIAMDCNNKAWELLDKIDLNEEEANYLTHMVHASAFHWAQVGNPLNMARSYYMLAKTCFITHKASEGKYWAHKCWGIVQDAPEKEAWDLPFAMEVMARASASEGDMQAYGKFKSQFLEATTTLSKEDVDVTRGEWLKAPWFQVDSSAQQLIES